MVVGYVQETERRDALVRTVTAAQSSVDLVKTLYRSGLTDFQNVLDSERSLSVQQDLLAESEGAVIRHLIGIYKALGGGWAPDEDEDEDEGEDETEPEPSVGE